MKTRKWSQIRGDQGDVTIHAEWDPGLNSGTGQER